MANLDVINQLSKKNMKDSITYRITIILVIIIFAFLSNEQYIKLSLITAIIVLVLVEIQYQISRAELIKSINNFMDKDYKKYSKLSDKLVQSNEKQQQNAQKYSNLLENVIQNVRLFKNTIIKSKEKTQNISLKMQETYDDSAQEAKMLEENLSAMQNLKHKIQIIAELIIELTDYVKQIGSTVSIVENISEQTNMLALNAAVEAARAGEYGKGFAVVAGEIRKLADESKQATNKITALVSEIEQTTSSTIIATEDGAKEVEKSNKFVSDISQNITAIVNNMKTLNSDLSEILNFSIEHQSISNDLSEDIDNMKKGLSEVLKTVEECINNVKDFSDHSSNGL